MGGNHKIPHQNTFAFALALLFVTPEGDLLLLFLILDLSVPAFLEGARAFRPLKNAHTAQGL